MVRRRSAAEPVNELRLRLWARGSDPTLLVACDSASPTNHHALLAPLAALDDMPAFVIHPADVALPLPGSGWREVHDLRASLGRIMTVASIGDHLAVGSWAQEQATTRGWRQVVVQHGLLTPFSPPPPPSSEVLAWSEKDATFLQSGRADLKISVVGSPILASAAACQAPHVSRFERPVFLGQLHGAELSRTSMTRSVTTFWGMTGATYRPHPQERDKLSRAQHAFWRRRGMAIDSASPLAEVDRPVVSAFSTGILEAAARGVPAWVFHVDPPPWLVEFWDRYGMRQWGEPPTPQPLLLTEDPAIRIARRFAGE
ncbi:prephenate dehydrogenase [Tessaracoccus sp. G1721]